MHCFGLIPITKCSLRMRFVLPVNYNYYNKVLRSNQTMSAMSCDCTPMQIPPYVTSANDIHIYQCSVRNVIWYITLPQRNCHEYTIMQCYHTSTTSTKSIHGIIDTKPSHSSHAQYVLISTSLGSEASTKLALPWLGLNMRLISYLVAWLCEYPCHIKLCWKELNWTWCLSKLLRELCWYTYLKQLWMQ